MAKSKGGGEPQLDVYCGLLFVAFASLVTASIVLFLQIKWNYGGF